MNYKDMWKNSVQVLCFQRVLLLIFWLGLTDTYSQIKTPQVIPPSPEAAALGRYASTPVGLYTGIPDISIPLYTIKTKELEVPISISYHAGGIKVTEIASNIGLSWALNAGGLISRSVVGLPDDYGFWYEGDHQTASQIGLNDTYYLKGIIQDQSRDGESDFYFYNFNGRTGKFIYPQPGVANPFLIPAAPINVVYTSGHYEITDEMGVLYKFERINNLDVTIGPVDALTNVTYAAGYYLTKMISADGTDVITFNYTPLDEDAYTEYYTNYTETIGQKCDPGSTTPTNENRSSNIDPRSRSIRVTRLTSIEYENGKVEFIPDFTRLDGPKSRVAEIKISTKNADGTYSLLKSFELGEGYFDSGYMAGVHRYRLKLTGLNEKDKLGAVIKKHDFGYNETTLPPYTSLAQDWWGYYNGFTGSSNTSLIQRETLMFNGWGYVIGGADRRANAEAMQAGILKKITYPTGGYTEFDYGPHHYFINGLHFQNEPRTVFAASGVNGDDVNLSQQTVTFNLPPPAGMDVMVKVVAICSDIKSGAEPYFPTILLKEQGIPGYILQYTNGPPYYTTPTPGNPSNSPRSEKEFYLNLKSGKTYEITAISRGNSNSTDYYGASHAKVAVSWNDRVEVPFSEMKMVGGLRINEIRDYPANGGPPIKKIYKYGVLGDGAGTLLIPEEGLSSARREILTRNYERGDPSQYDFSGCLMRCEAESMQFTSQPVYELTTLNGSPVAYPRVTVYEGDITAPNGRSVHEFDVQEDLILWVDKAYNNGKLQLNNSWLGGHERYTAYYVGNTNTKIKETFNNYSVLQHNYATGTKVGVRVVYTGCYDGLNPTDPSDVFYYFDYSLYSGIKKLSSTVEREYSLTDQTKYTENTTTYHYDNLGPKHQQLSRKTTKDSYGNTIENKYWYAGDYATSDPTIASLHTKNIIAIPIKEETHKGGQIISGKVNKLDPTGKPVEIHQYESVTPQTPPIHSNTVFVPAGYVKKADIVYNSTTKNIENVQLADNTNTVYLWGYRNSFPVAQVVNAPLASIAYAGFESDQLGGWSYLNNNTAVKNDIVPRAGKYYYKLNGGTTQITRTVTAGKYKLEYWAKGVVTVTLPGGTVTDLGTSSADVNGWILYTKEINATSSIVLTLSGTTSLDELRLYPVGAQMTTYTYEPSIGITSATDANNSITFYEYDPLGRLLFIKDNDLNIVKKYEYNYQKR